MIPIPQLLEMIQKLRVAPLSNSIQIDGVLHAVWLGKDGDTSNFAVTETFLSWLVAAAQQGQDRDCLTREEGDYLRGELAEATSKIKLLQILLEQPAKARP